ncbi:hypothetical protein PCANC_26281 [Puccinia coronata f. sp. avenae]|uniref:Tet-like 2OG-Fe(II) oxygenase domain-containing protein n=1 Tax=Puccinia coronata f. sp. avenae TaxID=200324 RepID=A0A2N5UGJ0_9BASI|nr:hypothetical protein PCANC_26281 [Puccinia coronata f. sp. avenae]
MGQSRKQNEAGKSPRQKSEHQKARDKESYDAKKVGQRVDSIRDKLTDKEQKLIPLTFEARHRPLDLFPGVTQKYQEDLAEKEAIEADYARQKLPKPNLPTVYKRNPTPKEIVPNSNKSKNIIADIHFTNLKTISQQMRANLDFPLAFLETSKRFVNPVKSQESAIAGTMWAIGWRKSMTHLEIVGVYANKAAIAKDPVAWDNRLLDARKAGEILWKIFEPMSNVALEANAKFLQERGLPGFFDTSLPSTSSDPPPAKINKAFSSSLTFMSKGFYNHPHCDKLDHEELPFALLLSLPTSKKDGSLALSSDGYNSLICC